MRLHRNARTTPKSRADLVRRIEVGRESVSQVAAELQLSRRTIYKWLRRHREEGPAGLEDRSSTPHRIRRRTSPGRIKRILALRRRRRTGWAIAQRLRMAPSTVHAVLRREGLARLSALDPKPAVRRFQRERAGELVHLDVKPLARIHRVGHRIHGDRSLRVYGAGWEYVHVAIDDATRLAYAEVLSDQRGASAVGFFERARRWYASQRIRVEGVITDNGSCYVSRRFRQALKRHAIRHLRTRAYRPQTNGKAERFIGTLLRAWAYTRPYRTSNQRTRRLEPFLRYYNERRPHRGLGMLTPSQRARRAA